MKIDILGGDWAKCECGDSFGTHYAYGMGIALDPLCFSCLCKLADQGGY